MPHQTSPVARKKVTKGTGVTEVHTSTCGLSAGKARCTCSPTYQAVVSVGSGEGRTRHVQSFSTEADAAQWRDDVKRGTRRGEAAMQATPERAPVPTVREAVTSFIERAGSGHILARGGNPYSATTLENYTRALQHHVLPFRVERYGCTMGDLRADLVDQRVMQVMADTLAATGRIGAESRAKAKAEATKQKVTAATGTGTARMAVAALRQVLADLSKRGLIEAAPPPPATMPAPPKPRDRRLGMDEAAAVVAAAYADDTRLGRSLMGPFVTLATRTGARRQELVNLRWGADGVVIAPVLDADGDRVEGDGGQPLFGGSVHIGRDTTKTDAGERTVAIDPGTAAALHRHRIASGNPADGSLVFPNPPLPGKRRKRGAAQEPVSMDTLKAAFRRLSTATGILALGTHLFRHSVASWAVAAGTDHVEVAARLGHSDASFTVRTYAHPDKDRIAREPLALDWEQATPQV